MTTLPATLREQYERDGYVIVRQVFPPEVLEEVARDADRAFEEYQHLIDTRNLRCRWQDNVFTGECQFDAFDPMIDLAPICGELARDRRLLDVLASLYGEPACLFKDKLIYKKPGAKGYQLHQDWIAWERFPRSFLSVVIPLDSATVDNGCTIVYPGYHQQGSLTPEDGNYHPLPADCVDPAKAVPLLLEPGDVGIFGGFTPHSSEPNVTDTSRRQLYLSYTKRSDGGELRDQHYVDFKAWLREKYAQYGKTDTYFK
jgi:ectoine hydroxylase-related dioxygenase (phytanoyl-CoA dioxygenase family)